MEMVKSRTIGVEMEGYVEQYPRDGMKSEMGKLNCDVGHDESLKNTYWEDDAPYGVEVRTEPLNDLSELANIANKLLTYGWSVDEKAGTHIHVDISDYTVQDKAKLLRFGKGIERIIFMYAEEYRYENNYCEPLPKGWRKIFWKNSDIAKKINWNDISDTESLDWYLHRNRLSYDLYNSKYHWMNIFSSNYPTVEFRLFHAMRSAEEIVSQANLVYSIVELVKNSTVEQLEFILKTIYSAPTVDGVVERFFQALSIEEPMAVKCMPALEYLVNKVEKKAATTNQAELQAI